MLHALFPEARAQVFWLLFADPRRELHLRELARQCRLAFRTVQVEVHKLTAAGLITSRKEGIRRLIRANPSSEVFDELRSLVNKSRERLGHATSFPPKPRRRASLKRISK
jgi:hypothetical protein